MCAYQKVLVPALISLEGFITAVQYHITAEKIDIIPDCPYLQDESSKNN
jgi:hypothetical protein